MQLTQTIRFDACVLEIRSYLKYCDLFDTFILFVNILIPSASASIDLLHPKCTFSPFFLSWLESREPLDTFHQPHRCYLSQLKSDLHLTAEFIDKIGPLVSGHEMMTALKNTTIAFFWALKKAIDHVWTQQSDRPKNRPSLFLGKRQGLSHSSHRI